MLPASESSARRSRQEPTGPRLATGLQILSARSLNELPPAELKSGSKLTETLQAQLPPWKSWGNRDHRKSGPCGIPQTVFSKRESGRRKAHRFWGRAFVTCTSKTCVRMRRVGNQPLPAMENSHCPKFDPLFANLSTTTSRLSSGKRNGIPRLPMPTSRCPTLHTGSGRIGTMIDCAGATLRRLAASDLPAALELSEQAGWNQTADDWRMLIDLAPEGCLAIEVNGELAATTTLLCYGQRLAWIGMVLTKKSYRGLGFARRLLTQALTLADEAAIETVKLDATDQGQPLYEKMGFRSEQAVERWIRPGTK